MVAEANHGVSGSSRQAPGVAADVDDPGVAVLGDDQVLLVLDVDHGGRSSRTSRVQGPRAMPAAAETWL